MILGNMVILCFGMFSWYYGLIENYTLKLSPSNYKCQGSAALCLRLMAMALRDGGF